MSTSPFDQFIDDDNMEIVPTRYIIQITVVYKNGTEIRISGEQLNQPLPVNKYSPWEEMQEVYKRIQEIKVQLDINLLEFDINYEVEELFREFNI